MEVDYAILRSAGLVCFKNKRPQIKSSFSQSVWFPFLILVSQKQNPVIHLYAKPEGFKIF